MGVCVFLLTYSYFFANTIVGEILAAEVVVAEKGSPFLHFTLRLLGGFPGFFNIGDSLLEGGNVCFSRQLMYLRGISYE